MTKRHILFWRYYKEWIETYKFGRVRPVTYDKYELAFRRIKEMRPKLYLDEITRADVQRLVNEYGQTHELPTVTDFLRHIEAPLRDAVYEGWIKKDPTYKVVPTSQIEHKEKQKWLESLDDVKKLTQVFKKYDNPVTTMFDFDIRTGLRFAELLGLTPKDVDRNNMTIYVNKTLDYKSRNPKFQPTKNKYSNRVIKIDWQALVDLQKVMEDCPENEPIFPRAYQKWRSEGNQLYGVRRRYRGPNNRIHNCTFNKALKKYCKEAGVYPISIHGLRHTHASILIMQGVSIQSVAKRLGHGNTTTTQRVYIHLLDDLAMKDDNKMMTVLSSL